MLDKLQYIMQTYVLNATELFIMGHEYGHLVKGHPASGKSHAFEVQACHLMGSSA